MISCSLFSAGLAGARVRRLLEEPPESRISIAGRVEFLRWLAPIRERLVRGGSPRDQSRSRQAEGCGLLEFGRAERKWRRDSWLSL